MINIISLQEDELNSSFNQKSFKFKNKLVKNFENLSSILCKNFKFLCFYDISFLYPNVKNHYFFAIVDNNIAGYLKISLNNNLNKKENYFGEWICDVEVLEEYRGKGVATSLYNETFKWLKNNDYKHILGSTFSDFGKNMENMIKRVAKENEIIYVRPENIMKAEDYKKIVSLIKLKGKKNDKIRENFKII